MTRARDAKGLAAYDPIALAGIGLRTEAVLGVYDGEVLAGAYRDDAGVGAFGVCVHMDQGRREFLISRVSGDLFSAVLAGSRDFRDAFTTPLDGTLTRFEVDGLRTSQRVVAALTVPDEQLPAPGIRLAAGR